MNYDKILSNYFINTKLNRISAKLCNLFGDSRKYLKYDNIRNYIEHRYSDSSCIQETIWRIHYGIETRPVCPVCGGRLTYYGKPNGLGLYSQYCSHKCCGIGTAPIVKATLKERYGDENYKNWEAIFITNIIKGGNICSLHSEIAKAKTKKTIFEKTGNEYWFQSEKGRDQLSISGKSSETIAKKELTSYCRFGETHYAMTKEYKEIAGPKISEIAKKIETQIKRRKTQKERGTINTSKQEYLIYQKLISIYGVENIINNDIIINEDNVCRYPYAVDFYVKSLDLYIEYNGYWAHGKHAYTGSKEDMIELDYWKQRDNEYFTNYGKHSSYYDAIVNWTITDVEKRELAKEKNLNYLEIWPTSIIDFEHLEQYCKHKPEHTCINCVYDYSNCRRKHTKNQLDIISKAK